MSEPFIAFRRQPRLDNSQRSSYSAAETRATLVAAAPKTPVPDKLEDLGLTPVFPFEDAVGEEHSFQLLPYMDAYVVKTTDPQLERAVKSVLAPDYLIVPNVEFAAPVPERGKEYTRKPQKPQWPAISGIEIAHQLGYRGKDVTVCILDTGIDADHREFRHTTVDFRYIPLDTVAGKMRDCRGFDVDGHGTHVAGIIAGEGFGIAPEVELKVAAVLESETLKTSLERVVVALDWLLSQFEHEENLGKPVIVNMSLGFSNQTMSRTEYQKASAAMTMMIDTLVNDFAVLPITAVGNEGKGRVRAPAYFPNTLSVGAVDSELRVAPFSGSGVSPITKEIEPNLMGYGVDVVSGYERDRRNRSLYRALSGTSMATPYVTGIAALYACCGQRVQGRDLSQCLIRNSLPIPNAPSGRTGAGLARFVQEATS